MEQENGIKFEEFDYKKLLLVIYRKKWLILLFPILFFMPVYLYLRYTPSVYEAESTLKIDVGENEVISEVASRKDPGTSENAATKIEILKSREMLSKVIDKLDLEVSYFIQARVISSAIYQSAPFKVVIDTSQFAHYDQRFEIIFLDDNHYRLQRKADPEYSVKGKLDQTVAFDNQGQSRMFIKKQTGADLAGEIYEFTVNSRGALIRKLKSRLNIEPFRGEALYKLSYQDQVPRRAKDIINKLTDVYLKEELEYRQKSYEQTLNFIDTLMARVQQQLGASEDTLETFEERNDISTFQLRKEYKFTKLSEMQKRLAEIQVKRMELKSLQSYLNEKLATEAYQSIKFAPVLEGVLNPVVNEQVKVLNEILGRLKNLLQQHKRASPVVQNEVRRLNNQKEIIAEALANTQKELDRSERYVRNEIQQIRQQASQYPELERDLSKVKRNFTINEDIYNLLQRKRTETSIAKAAIVSKSRVINPAVVPSEPISPEREKFMIGSIILGLFFGLGLVVIREILRTTVSFRNDLETMAPVPVIGEIIRMRSATYDASITVLRNTKSLVSESFRVLRANLLFMLSGEDHHLLAVTSTVGKEGKSFISLNLAGIFSLLGKKVVLVDLDLRKPRLHLSMNLNNEAGASTYLIGRDTLDEVVQLSAYQNLDVITCGPIPPNPSELLSGERIKAFISELSEQYDYVILDTSPVGLVTDAIPLMKYTDINLYIFSSDYSNKAFLNNVKRLKEDHDLRNLYLIFNFAMPSKGKGYGFGYDYGYAYGYGGYGYGGYIQGHGDEDAAPNSPWWKFW